MVAPGASEGVVCGQQVQTRFGGPASIGLPASTLQPEESKSWNFGFILEPNPAFSFGMDFWWIRLENQIDVIAEQAIFADPVKFASKFFRCSQVTPAQRDAVSTCLNFPNFDPIAFIDQPTENLGNLNTNGVDINLQFRLPPTSYGQVGEI